MNSELAADRSLLKTIQAGILIWGVVLAVGVVWYDYVHAGVNLWKPAIILAGVALFLVFWSLALAQRQRRRVKSEE